MNYMVTKKGVTRVLFTTDSYEDAFDFVNEEVSRQSSELDYLESENDRFEKLVYIFEQYEITFG